VANIVKGFGEVKKRQR